jgi:flagellar capping protein FliD
MTEQELLNLKHQIEEKKAEITKLESRKDLLMEQLYEQFSIKSIPDAEKKLKSMEKQIKEWQDQIDTATQELENQLNEE